MSATCLKPWLRWPTLTLVALGMAACSTAPRLHAPPSLIDEARPAGFPPDVRLLSIDIGAFNARSARFFEGLRDAANDGSVNILSLSGGGSGSAFGAGALVGLNRAAALPQFALVTGVSAGALIAPFAFLGPSWDDRLEMAFAGPSYRLLASPLLNLLHLILSPLESGSHAALFDMVDGYVTPTMIDAVALENARGRRLIVATTDLDKQEMVLWNMGAIAARGGAAARELFRDVLVASASVPGAFPPVLISVRDGEKAYQELHVDGSVTSPVFIEPLVAGVRPTDSPNLRGAHLYMIVNGALAHVPATTPVNTLDVLADSFSASTTYRTRDAIAGTIEMTRRLGMQFKLTEIPANYPLDGFVDFNASRMRKLFDFGVTCAVRGQLWLSAEESIANNVRSRQTSDLLASRCPAEAPSN